MVRIGIIGAGRMGNSHAGNLKLIKDAQLTAVYDINPEKSAAFVEKFPGIRVCNSAAEVAESSDVDLVLVTSPTYCHEDGVMAIMKTGKPIFCEKPLCRTREQLARLAPLVKSYSNLFAIGFVRRYSPATMVMKQLLAEGKIGKPICASVNCTFGGFKREWGDWFADYEKSGGAPLDMLAHHCDLINMMLGKPKTVYAQSLMLNPKAEKPADYVSATAVCPSGVIVNLECSWLRSGPSATYMVVYGDKGTLRLSDANGVEFFAVGNPTPEKMSIDEGLTGQLQEVISGGMYAIEMGTLIDCIKNGTKPRATADDAIAAMHFCLAMLESSETGKVIEL